LSETYIPSAAEIGRDSASRALAQAVRSRKARRVRSRATGLRIYQFARFKRFRRFRGFRRLRRFRVQGSGFKVREVPVWFIEPIVRWKRIR
jgi:hypothetical protein